MRASRALLESRDAQNQDKSSSFGQMVGESLGRKLLSGSSGSNHCGFHHSHNVGQVWVQKLENQESDWCRDREGDLLGRNPFWGPAAVAINRSMALPTHRKVKINPQLFLEKKWGKKTCRHHGSRFTHTVNSTSTCALYYTPRRSSSQRLLLLSRCNRIVSPTLVKKLLNTRCREQGTNHPPLSPDFLGTWRGQQLLHSPNRVDNLGILGVVLFLFSLYTCCRALHSQGQGEIISREGRRTSLLTAASQGK